MKFILFPFIFSFFVSGCEEKKNIAHLNDPLFIEENPVSDKFGAYDLYDRMSNYKIPGISISVVKDGVNVWNAAYGLSNVENNVKVTPQTLFQAGSISKPIAALGILKLTDKGLLDLDQDVNVYLRGYRIPQSDNNFGGPTATLRGILSHTAGLNVSGIDGYILWEDLPTTEELISGKGNFNKIEVIYPPYSEWNYSGGGYTVAQKIIEDVTSQSFEKFMEKEIFDALEMSSTTYQQPLPLELHHIASSGYGTDGNMIKGKWQVFPAKAAAGLWTIPSDLARYCIEIMDIYNGQINSGILSKEMVDIMFSNPFHAEVSLPTMPNNYKNLPHYWGLGPLIVNQGQNRRFQHGGSNAGFKANFTAFMNRQDAIIIMTNGDNGYALIQEVEKVLADYYNMNIR